MRHVRLAAGLTQAVLAEKAGLSTRAIQHLEAGRGYPYPESMRRLADALSLGGADRVAFEAGSRRAPRPLAKSIKLANANHNLPPSLTSFVGREQQTTELRRLLVTGTASRLLTLVGVGGAGKTRLALEVARTVVDRYPDGVWLVELAPLGASLVAQQVAAVLGIAQAPGRPIATVLASALRDSRLLLVLDNCEHVLDACGSLAEALLTACPGVQILATSRTVLGVTGETIWPTPSLSVADAHSRLHAHELVQFEAVRLFMERARLATAAFELTDQNAAAVASICQRLDGIPLALELAAARVRTLGVADLADRLDDCFRVLVGGSPSQPARQQTLRAAVDWSYDLLTPAERHVFAQLAVFSGGCTLEAVEAVCAGDGSAVNQLGPLVDQSLVIADPRADGTMRYRLLETLRQYASERLEAGGAGGLARARHSAYFCEVLPRWWTPAWWGAQIERRIAAVEQDLDNLRAALRWLIAAGRVGPALELGWAMAPFWLLTARVGEGRAWLAELVALSETTQGTGPTTPARAGVVVWLGGLSTQDGDYVAGRQALNKGLILARECGDKLALAFALEWLSILSQYCNEPTVARAYAEEGLAVSHAGGYRGLEGMHLRILAQIALDLGELAEALSLAQDSLAACLDAEHPSGVAWALSALGQIHFLRGEHVAARSMLEESLVEGHAMGAPAIRLNVLVYLAWTLLEQGDLEAASARGQEALERARAVLGGRSFLALPLEVMAQVAAAADQPARALRLAGAASVRRENSAARITPTQSEQLERWLCRARAALDPDSANAAWLHGRALSTERAIAEALMVHTRSL